MLLVAGISTTAIGLLPTYAAIGIWAPIFLVILRFVQGFSFGGEYGGAILMVSETAPREKRGFYTRVHPGIIGARRPAFDSRTFRCESHATGNFRGMGLENPVPAIDYPRRDWPHHSAPAQRDPVYKDAESQGKTSRKPILEVIKTNPKQLLLAAGISFGFGTLNYVVLGWLLSYTAVDLKIGAGLGLIAPGDWLCFRSHQSTG